MVYKGMSNKWLRILYWTLIAEGVVLLLYVVVSPTIVVVAAPMILGGLELRKRVGE